MAIRSTEEQDYEAKITEEGLARARSRIEVESPHLDPYNEFATVDSIRNYAHSIGDANPLYCDPEYAKNTRWRNVISQPTMYNNTMGVSEVKEIPPQVREKGRSALAGVHQWYSGDDIEWFRPVYPGDRLTVRSWESDVIEKKSRFTGRAIQLVRQSAFINQRGELICIHKSHRFAGERAAGGQSTKYKNIERTVYTPEMLEKIAQDYEREHWRGSQVCWFEDVKVGEELTPVVLGPLTVTDMLAFIKGGYSPFVRTGKLRHEYQKRHPRALLMNQWGIPDVVERVHWEDDLAIKIGSGWAYDYGAQRVAWISRIACNWMGDDAWLWKQHDEFRLFVYIGDTIWVKGKVTDKSVDEHGNSVVEADAWCEDQRGRITAPGHVWMLLPSRERGPVMLPPRRPPADLEGQRPVNSPGGPKQRLGRGTG